MLVARLWLLLLYNCNGWECDFVGILIDILMVLLQTIGWLLYNCNGWYCTIVSVICYYFDFGAKLWSVLLYNCNGWYCGIAMVGSEILLGF